MRTEEKKRKRALLAMTFVLGGVFGFIYEELFYRIDLGYFVKRGTTFGPWIPIYGFGAVGIILFAYRLKKKPALLILLSCLGTGLLEFLTGYVLFHVWQVRLWDYNVEIWNFGNIGGYVCLRSVLFFGLSAVILCYLAYPVLEKLHGKMENRKNTWLAYLPAGLFVLDIVCSIACKAFG